MLVTTRGSNIRTSLVSRRHVYQVPYRAEDLVSWTKLACVWVATIARGTVVQMYLYT